MTHSLITPLSVFAIAFALSLTALYLHPLAKLHDLMSFDRWAQ